MVWTLPIIESIRISSWARYFIRYEEPMEVHPPHHPLHSWKDFFIHIATITVGLLIAIGLEQSVEALHHRHQRHQLEEDLREEGERNRETVRKDIAYRTAFMVWTLEVNHCAREALAGKIVPLPPRPDRSPEFQAQYRYVVPSNSVWSVAKSSGEAALLPPWEALVYTRLYRVHELVTELDLEDRRANSAYGAALLSVSDDPPNPPLTLEHLTPAQLNTLSDAALRGYASANNLRTMIGIFGGANDAVLNGASTEQEVVEGIYRGQYAVTPPAPTHGTY